MLYAKGKPNEHFFNHLLGQTQHDNGHKKKKSCPTCRTAHTPCYEKIENADSPNGLKDCNCCPIYLNRDQRKMALFDKL